jgi:hypothetical protein
MKTAQNAQCHPSEPNQAKGLCAACYQRQRRALSQSARIAHRQANRKWAQENPEARARFQRKSRYGLSDEDFRDLFDAQMGLCAICYNPMTPICVDHNHLTQQVRGLLCVTCNFGLGIVEKLFRQPGFASYWQRIQK